MPCYPWHTDLPKPMHGHMCTGRRMTTCWVCGEPAVYLCDHPAGDGTCDAAMCPAHSATVAEDEHHCGAHYTEPPE